MQDENREVEEKIINWGGRKRKSIGCISEERRKEKKGWDKLEGRKRKNGQRDGKNIEKKEEKVEDGQAM